MQIEKFVPGESKNVAAHALWGMMRGVDIDKSYADMMRYRISGKAAEDCNDIYYIAHEDGIAVSRHWNGWGKHPDAIGNWGNFYTADVCRGKGIGGKLLNFWYEDFQNTDNLPLCFLCSAGTKELTDLYRRFGFRPAMEGRDKGPLYMPVGNAPETFRAFYQSYYQPSEVLYHKPASVGYRHEIDCLLYFAYRDMGLDFGIGEWKKVEEVLLYAPERGGMLFAKDGHCVGWSVDGQKQIYPLYVDSVIMK